MRVSAKADYAVRAVLELAAATDSKPLKRDQISAAQNIPSKFLETIMLELKHAGIVKSTRGAGGGYALARPAEDISVAERGKPSGSLIDEERSVNVMGDDNT